MQYCLYYQAHIKKEFGWLLSASLRFSEHIAFDRCFDKQKGIFEFFVTEDCESIFLDVMHKLELYGAVSGLVSLPNRLAKSSEIAKIDLR